MTAAAEVTHSLQALAVLPAVAGGAEAAREACTQLRWHPALRRRIPEAAVESLVRGAHASASLEGVRVDLAAVRRAFPAGGDQLPAGAAGDVARGAVLVAARVEQLRPALASGAVSQLLTQLQIAAAGPGLPEAELGRLREAGEECRELVEVGPALPAGQIAARLEVLGQVLRAPGDVPALIVAAIAHAEVATVRPFVRGNALVARALERLVIQTRGLDPTGVAVPEAGHLAAGPAAYQGALAAYAEGRSVELWLVHCAQAITKGAEAGHEVADAVLAGRL